MELSRHEYPALLGALQPGQAISVLKERIRIIDRVNADIADWLQERRRLEEQYVDGLKRLAQRPQKDNASELGVFQDAWHAVIRSTVAIADSHTMLAVKIREDVEDPLKYFASRNKEMQNMSNIQGNLTTIARDVESAQKKADKLKEKNATTGKLASANSGVESAAQEWESQAPYVFEQLQALDETRLNHLRDALTQFLTHEVDEVERSRAAAEECLNVLLNIKTEDEVKTFALKTAEGKAQPLRRPSHAMTTNLHPPSTPHNNAPEDDGEFSGSSPKTSSKSRHGAFGGLKRLGTVMTRRKNSGISPRPSSPKKPHRAFFGRGENSKSTIPIPSRPGSQQDLSMASPVQDSEAPITPDVPREGTSYSQETPQENQNEPPSSAQPDELPAQENTNGVTSGSNNPFGIVANASATPPTDNQGFSVPPVALDAITQAQQEAAAANETPGFNFNIRDEPIKEENAADAQAAFDNVANTLRQAQLAAPTRRSSTLRGRRDVRNTIYISPESSESLRLSTPPGPASTSSVKLDHLGSDAQSVRSSHSLGSTTSAAIKHVDMHFPGLNASIVETVGTTFKNGQITKSSLIGEMALVYNRSDFSEPLGRDMIRLEKFEALEKVASNPTFVTQIPDRPGEYHIGLAQLVRQNVAFKYQAHIEQSNLASFSPILLTSVWKNEPTQSSVITTYQVNPLFAPIDEETISLKNVIIIIHLEGGKPTKCQSKPVGIFSKDKSLIYWKLGDLTLSRNGAVEKLLARFTTETQARPGNVDARWEIVSELSSNPPGSGLGVTCGGSDGDKAKEASEENDPFADDGSAPGTGDWKPIPTARKLVGGKYLCQ